MAAGRRAAHVVSQLANPSKETCTNSPQPTHDRYAATTLVYALFTTAPKGSRHTHGPALPLCLITYNVIVTVLYLRHPNPVFHQCAYALIHVATVIFSIDELYENGVLRRPLLTADLPYRLSVTKLYAIYS